MLCVYSIIVLVRGCCQLFPFFPVSLPPIAVIRQYTQLHHRAGRRSRHTSRTKLSQPRPSQQDPLQASPNHPKRAARYILRNANSSALELWPRALLQAEVPVACGHSIRHLVSAQLNSTSPNTASAGSFQVHHGLDLGPGEAPHGFSPSSHPA